MKPILPGSTIGVLGSGQLGRMFAIAARRLGYRVHTYSPDRDTPTGQIADIEIDAPYEDLDRVKAFAAAVDVVTFEFENVPAPTADAAASAAPVAVTPAAAAPRITQPSSSIATCSAQAGVSLSTKRPNTAQATITTITTMATPPSHSAAVQARCRKRLTPLREYG